MTLEISEDLSAILGSGQRPAADAARELIVFELYRERRVSGGRAAELLGLRREDFYDAAAARGIPYIDFKPEEVELELAAAARLTNARSL